MSKIYTAIISLTLIAALATVAFQAMEMNAYSLFETLLK